MNKKIILVVGGAGYIGSHVNKLLKDAGYNTVVLDNLSRGNREAVLFGSFLQGDIADSACLDALFSSQKIDAVMDFAAFIDVGESMGDPLKYYRNNVGATVNLLEAMRRYDVKTFIFSSTAAIFGLPQQHKINESHPCMPINPYGRSKLMVEHILADLESTYGIKSSCLRYFNAAGGDPDGEIKYFPRKESNLIPLVLKNLKNPSGALTIYGTDYPTADGTCIRDYIHINDLGSAHIAAMEQLFAGAPSSHYNLGNGEGFSVREVIAAAEKVTGLKVNVVEGDRRPGDPPILMADFSKARRELKWKPRFSSLETMISHAWKAMG